jgi:hypothetical protein
MVSPLITGNPLRMMLVGFPSVWVSTAEIMWSNRAMVNPLSLGNSFDTQYPISVPFANINLGDIA